MSRYENYEIKNNVFGTLSAPISSLATTIQLGDGQGQRFSENMLATLENIENGKVMKREIVLITAINGDTLTVTRKYAPCPDNDEANTQGQVSYAFSTDDTISAYIDKEHFDEIKKSINDIYENGLDKLRTDVVSGLQISVSAGPVLVGSSYYEFAGDTITLTNNTTNYVEIDEDGNLVANTTGWTLENTKISKVITSGGAITSIEDWRLGTVGGKIGGTDIHELTEKNNLSPNDEFILADSENIYQNKKTKLSSIKGISGLPAFDNIEKGDILNLQSGPDVSESGTNYSCIGFDTSGRKLAFKRIGNGESFSSLKIVVSKTGTPSSDLSIRIETDDNGKPSGTLINANAVGTIAKGDITTTLTEKTVSLGGDISIESGVCWIVLSFGSYSNSNYYNIGGVEGESNFFGCKVYDGTNWNNYDNSVKDRFQLTNTEVASFNVSLYYVYDISFSDDGSKMYVCYASNKTIRQYTLSTPRDITTATFDSKALKLSSAPRFINFHDNGSKFYVLQSTGTTEYTLSTPRDIITATATGKSMDNVDYFKFSPDGTKGIGQSSGTSFWNLSFSTPFDISTVTKTSAGYIRMNNQLGMRVSDDGKTLYSRESDVVVKYQLTTAWDFTTASVVGTVSTSGGLDGGLYIRPDGLYWYYVNYYGYSDYYGVIKQCKAYTEQIFGEITKPYISADGLYNDGVVLASADSQLNIPSVKMNSMGDYNMGESVHYNIEFNEYLSGLTAGTQYFLSDTPGKVSSTVGTIPYSLGIAINDNVIKYASLESIIPVCYLPTQRSGNGVKKKFTVAYAGTYRIYWMVKGHSASTSYTVNFKIQKNGTDIYTDTYYHQMYIGGATNVDLNAGDEIGLYIGSNGTPYIKEVYVEKIIIDNSYITSETD